MEMETPLGPLVLRSQLEQWRLAMPFRITGYVFEKIDVLRVTLESRGCIGQGEAAGVYFKQDTPERMLKQIEALRVPIEAGISFSGVQQLLPPGGARNALDCALWDLSAAVLKDSVCHLAGLEDPRPLTTTFGCGADTPEKMAAQASLYTQARAIKLKLTGEEVDADRIRAVRKARPDVWLAVDANQGFSLSFLEKLMPVLVKHKVELIEQPLKVGEEHLLDGFSSPIPIAADESVHTAADISRLVGRFDTINIKLDKCGGLTEALSMARKARELGLDTMVGNMIGTSLAMAPAFVVGQLCSVVDLDGPLFLAEDRSLIAQYTDGFIDCPAELWGNGGAGVTR